MGEINFTLFKIWGYDKKICGKFIIVYISMFLKIYVTLSAVRELGWSYILNILSQLARALQSVKNEDYVIGDLKPDNILIDNVSLIYLFLKFIYVCLQVFNSLFLFFITGWQCFLV